MPKLRQWAHDFKSLLTPVDANDPDAVATKPIAAGGDTTANQMGQLVMFLDAEPDQLAPYRPLLTRRCRTQGFRLSRAVIDPNSGPVMT
jgi:hypothetical protein